MSIAQSVFLHLNEATGGENLPSVPPPPPSVRMAEKS
jgi:hypothetical protein